jgi:threonine aldolase
MKTIDFRSDTVTQPTAAMREAMMKAPLGDDVYGEDPTANALEEKAAALLGFPAALYGVSGTQTNLLGLMSHCERGHEVIVGQAAHTYRWEAGGMAVLGSIQPQPLEQRADGTMDLAAIEAAIKPDDAHYAITKLIALENTWGGRVLPPAYVRDVRALATRRGLSTHLDGARLFNAATAIAQEKKITAMAAAKEICAQFDSVSICLSKGLGAPMGALLLGSREQIKKARRLRKMIGGGLRQVGIVAAAGAYALEHHVERMAEDHENATRLAQALTAASNGALKCETPQTNMVWVDVPAAQFESFSKHLAANNVRVNGLYGRLRWVTHLDVSGADVDRAGDIVAAYFKK